MAKNDVVHAQAFAIISIFVLLHHYQCSGRSSLAMASKLGSNRKTGSIGKVVLGRWFLLWWNDSFGVFETKAILKYLAGRRVKVERRELSHYKPGEFTRNLRKKNKKTNQTDFGF